MPSVRPLTCNQTPRDAHIYLALALTEAGHYEAAIRTLDNLTEERTSDGRAPTALSYALCRAGRLEKARAAALLAVRELPQAPESHRALGWALLGSSLPADALRSFREALRLAPDDVDAEVGQGAALSMLGEHRAALASFQRASTQSDDWLEDYPELRTYVDASERALESGQFEGSSKA
jgi:Flp pilus assembly protein TadD